MQMKAVAKCLNKKTWTKIKNGTRFNYPRYRKVLPTAYYICTFYTKFRVIPEHLCEVNVYSETSRLNFIGAFIISSVLTHSRKREKSRPEIGDIYFGERRVQI